MTIESESLWIMIQGNWNQDERNNIIRKVFVTIHQEVISSTQNSSLMSAAKGDSYNIFIDK